MKVYEDYRNLQEIYDGCMPVGKMKCVGEWKGYDKIYKKKVKYNGKIYRLAFISNGDDVNDIFDYLEWIEELDENDINKIK